MHNKGSKVFTIFVFAIVLVIMPISIVGMTKTSHHENCTVSSKERVYLFLAFKTPTS